MTLLDELYAKRELIKECAYACGLERDVKVFGSVARGEEGPDSDVDLLVRYDPNRKQGWNVYDFAYQAEEIIGRKVDTVFEAGLHRMIREGVLSEAKPL